MLLKLINVIMELEIFLKTKKYIRILAQKWDSLKFKGVNLLLINPAKSGRLQPEPDRKGEKSGWIVRSHTAYTDQVSWSSNLANYRYTLDVLDLLNMLDGDYSDSIRAAELQMVLITPVRRFRYSTANGSIACEAVVLCTIRATAPSLLRGY